MGSSEFHNVEARQFNNYNEAVRYFSAPSVEDGGRDRRISMTCTEKKFNSISSRSGNNSRLLEMAYSLMEAFIGTDGVITSNDVVLIESMKENAHSLTAYLDEGLRNGAARKPSVASVVSVCTALKIN